MLLLDQALALLKSEKSPVLNELVDLQQSLGRVLAADVCSDLDMPPFNKASVDGYACRMSDLDKPLMLIETVAAGAVPTKPLLPGQCTKIMTGAKVPDGADCVVMVEHTHLDADGKVVVEILPKKSNIALKAEDIRQGDIVLRKGTLLKASHLAVAASVGATLLTVASKPSICVFSTGNELVAPSSKPAEGQIRDANSSQLLALLQGMQLEAAFGGIIPDREAETEHMIAAALQHHDVLLLSGGISMGDFDYVPRVLHKLGFEIRFKSLAVQPGRPTVFASSGRQFILALPGNPVSSFNIFTLLGIPFLYHLMGHDYKPPVVKLPLSEDFVRKNAERQLFVPVSITADGRLKPLDYHGSAHINAFTDACGLMCIPAGIKEIKAGEPADVRLF
ncbi:MAG TPA: molybdopterin molybdotransferase MoeA [Bacteroidales bacterium]|nr:molybdopterin molybdotransferase MoeA [Bacteroidales bacterium]